MHFYIFYRLEKQTTMFCSDCRILIFSGNIIYDSINLESLESFIKQNSAVYHSNTTLLTKIKLQSKHSTRLCIYKLPISWISMRTNRGSKHTSTSYTSKKPAAEMKFSNLNIKLEDHVQNGSASNPKSSTQMDKGGKSSSSLR